MIPTIGTPVSQMAVPSHQTLSAVVMKRTILVLILIVVLSASSARAMNITAAKPPVSIRHAAKAAEQHTAKKILITTKFPKALVRKSTAPAIKSCVAAVMFS